MLMNPRLAAGIAALFAGVAQGQYTLNVAYDSTNFFETWDFFTATDPTSGFVQYVDQATASAAGLANVTASGQIYMGVDSTTVNPPSGRQSVRLTSQQAFTHGLFIADIEHMPASDCSVWPSWWAFGPNWPGAGEIDIIEGVNTQTSNQMTLHTSPGCVVTSDGAAATTTLTNGDCNSGNAHDGCPEVSTDNQNYGDGFNAVQGGVYAMEWTSDFIAIYFFPRSQIPADITSESPTPANWGQPLGKFNGGAGCTLDDHFQSNNLVFDITFCGAWAGQVWGSNAECSALAGTCQDYVSNNPSAFADTYWTVNSIKVYNNAGQA